MKIKTIISKAGSAIKKHSPEILIGAGIATGVASVVVACIETTKAQKILEQHRENLEAIHTVANDEELREQYEYDEKAEKKDLAVTYIQTGAKLALNYLPAFLLGATSVTCFLASNGIMRKRNAALTAAATVAANELKDYREGVISRFGEKVDYEIRNHIHNEDQTVTVTDENGKKKKVKTQVSVQDTPATDDNTFNRVFDENNPNWEKDAEYNFLWLKNRQKLAQQTLEAQGHLFLNEVYDMLGYPRTAAGQVVGWVYNPDTPYGDDYVDFGVFDIHDESVRSFINGNERSIWLNFNVAGPILNYI